MKEILLRDYQSPKGSSCFLEISKRFLDDLLDNLESLVKMQVFRIVLLNSSIPFKTVSYREKYKQQTLVTRPSKFYQKYNTNSSNKHSCRFNISLTFRMVQHTLSKVKKPVKILKLNTSKRKEWNRKLNISKVTVCHQ